MGRGEEGERGEGGREGGGGGGKEGDSGEGRGEGERDGVLMQYSSFRFWCVLHGPVY